MMEFKWHFDDPSNIGISSGGNAASKAFDDNFRDFVREVLQNSNDAIVDEPGEVRFSLENISLDDEFKKKLDWQNFMSHIDGVSKEGEVEKVDQFLSSVEENSEFRLFKIEDFGCKGLKGEEQKKDNYASMVKGDLISFKDDNAQGSQGIGKNVLWKFSEIETVLFHSEPIETHTQHRNRFIGRTKLSTHSVEGQRFGGDALFGEKAPEDVHSVWGDTATKIAKNVKLDREMGETGTSIGVVGFSDPTKAEKRSKSDIMSKIRDAAIENFWPAIYDPEKRLTVKTEDEEIEPSDKQKYVHRYTECLEAYRNDSTVEELDKPGDIISVDVSVQVPEHKDDVELPEHRDKREKTEATAKLVIQLLSDESTISKRNKIALVRGPRMVVDYWKPPNIYSAKPFIGILLAGEAKDPNDPTKADKDLEHYLRKSEGAKHNKWASTQDLSMTYKPPYAKQLKTNDEEGIFFKIQEKIQQHLNKDGDSGDIGAEKLSKMFPLGEKGGGGGEKSPLSYEGPRKSYEGGEWSFNGSITPKEEGEKWNVKVKVQAVNEDGRPIRDLDVKVDNIESGSYERIADEKAVKLFSNNTGETIDYKLKAVDEEFSGEERVRTNFESTFYKGDSDE